jgi:hypothetical protein
LANFVSLLSDDFLRGRSKKALARGNWRSHRLGR